MTEFEKWWKNKYYDWPPLRKSEKKYAEEAWKTALKWALKQVLDMKAANIEKELNG